MKTAPIVITEKTGNNLTLVLGILAVGGLAIYAWSKYPKQVSVHGIQSSSQSALQAIARAIHGEIDGITIIGRVEPFQQALNLPDGDFIRLYNIYNEMFPGETMTAAVADEWSWWGSYSFMVVQENFLNRCAALNLP